MIIWINDEFTKLAGCIEAPASIGPTLDWQQCQLADFSSLRLDIAQLKSSILESRHLRSSLETRLVRMKWFLLNCSGNKIYLHYLQPDLEDQEGWLNFCLNTQRPLLRVILSMNQPLVEQVLEYLVEAVEDKKEIGQGFGEWIFGLLVALELPLTPDTCSCLRSLARACSIIRANMVIDFSSIILVMKFSVLIKSWYYFQQVETNVKEIAALNLFICLVARYFRQMDLVDS